MEMQNVREKALKIAKTILRNITSGRVILAVIVGLGLKVATSYGTFDRVMSPKKVEVFQTVRDIDNASKECMANSKTIEERCDCVRSDVGAIQELRTIYLGVFKEGSREARFLEQIAVHVPYDRGNILMLNKGRCPGDIVREEQNKYNGLLRELNGKRERVPTIVSRHFPKATAR